MVRVPTHRQPTHPGEMLLEEFLIPMGLTQRQLADAIQVPYQRVNEIVNRRRGITPATALRLARFFGMSASFWLDLQIRWDLFQAQSAEQVVLDRIHPYGPAQSAATHQIAESDEEGYKNI
jgi:addiction module HigA family antidote